LLLIVTGVPVPSTILVGRGHATQPGLFPPENRDA
jgi:hypothetical protein